LDPLANYALKVDLDQQRILPTSVQSGNSQGRRIWMCFLGFSWSTVSRLFSQLQRDGLIQIHQRALELKDVGRLRAIADH
jgi:hypothetical protein